MSLFLIFCVLAAAGWLLLSLTNRDSSDRPDASVAAYSRAMEALSPQHEHRSAARQPVRPGPAGRPARPRQRTAPAGPRRSAPVARSSTRR